MPALNGNQFKDFAIERALAAQGNEDQISRSRGFQALSSNLFAPNFGAVDYNELAPRNPSPARAFEPGEEEGRDEEEADV